MVRLHTHDQHFLRSPRVVAELVGHSNLKRSDTVVDLGAGSGVITSVLAKRCEKVIAVENEPHALRMLRKNMQDVENVDIQSIDLSAFDEPTTDYAIFSNIPFRMSSSVVRKFCTSSRPPRIIYLIVQKQFARKLVPGDDHFTSQLGAEIGPWWNVRIRKPLRRTDFTPPPAVDTVLMELKPREGVLLDQRDRGAFIQFVVQCYSRQTYFQACDRSRAGISAEKRPSQLTVEEWVKLYHANHSR